jgi:hypothetical protein
MRVQIYSFCSTNPNKLFLFKDYYLTPIPKFFWGLLIWSMFVLKKQQQIYFTVCTFAPYSGCW